MAEDVLGSLRPEVKELARLVAFAARVEPQLLRAMRLRFLPSSDAGLEADLWFSPVVESRTPSGFVFERGAAEALLRDLYRDPAYYESVWSVFERHHQHLPATIRLEEEIAYLQMRSDSTSTKRIQELLRQAIASMTDKERDGLSLWASRALPRLPSVIERFPEAAILETGARLAADQELKEDLPGDEIPDWVRLLAPESIPRVPVRLRLTEGGLEVGDIDAADTVEIRLPETYPMVVEVQKIGVDERYRRIAFERDEVGFLDVTMGALRLRSLLGEVWELEPNREIEARHEAERIDYEPELSRHRPFLGAEAFDDVFRRWLTGRLSLYQVSGSPGTGKTACLAHLVDYLREQQQPFACHFFRRDVFEYSTEAAAYRSLSAQIEGRFPELRGPAEDPRHRLQGLLGRFSQQRGTGSHLWLIVDGRPHDWDPEAPNPIEMLHRPEGVSLVTTDEQAREPGLHLDDFTQRETQSAIHALFESVLERVRGLAAENVDQSIRLSGANWAFATLLRDAMDFDVSFSAELFQSLEQLVERIVDWSFRAQEPSIRALLAILAVAREAVPREELQTVVEALGLPRQASTEHPLIEQLHFGEGVRCSLRARDLCGPQILRRLAGPTGRKGWEVS